MNNNLSAGPTLEDLEQPDNQPTTDPDTTDTDNTTDTNENTNAITWHCPYCNYNNTDLSNVRTHITESIEEDHEGVAGWSPTRDIIGRHPDTGEELRRIEGAGERPDEDHHLSHGEKKTLIINAWLANDKNRDINAISSILPVSEGYVQRITKQLEEGEITQEEYRNEMDWELRNDLGDRLETHYENTDTTDMSLTTTETDDELEHGSKKQQIINAWLLDSELNYTDLDDVLPANKEYIGRVFRDLNNNEITHEEIEDAANREFQTELIEELKDNDVAVNTVPTTTIDNTDTETTENDSETDQPEYQDTLDDARKKTRILNSVLVARDFDVDLTNKEIAGAAHSSSQYAQRLTKQIKDGEITDEELEANADQELQEALVAYYVDNDIITENVAPDTSSTDDTDTDTETGTGDDVEPTVDIDLSNEDNPFENVPVSKRDALVNVFVFDSNMSKADAADLTGASAEYARQTYNGIQDGTYDPTEYLNEAIQNTLKQFDTSGELDAFFANEKDDDVESEEHEAQNTDTETDTADDVEPTATTATTDNTPTTDSTDTTRTTRTQGEGDTVPVSDIEDIRDTADTLYRQAQYESDGDDKKAEFVAKEIRDRLDTLLEQTD